MNMSRTCDARPIVLRLKRKSGQLGFTHDEEGGKPSRSTQLVRDGLHLVPDSERPRCASSTTRSQRRPSAASSASASCRRIRAFPRRLTECRGDRPAAGTRRRSSRPPGRRLPSATPGVFRCETGDEPGLARPGSPVIKSGPGRPNKTADRRVSSGVAPTGNHMKEVIRRIGMAGSIGRIINRLHCRASPLLSLSAVTSGPGEPYPQKRRAPRCVFATN